MSWNYRVAKLNNELGIYSIYYNDSGKVVSWSLTPAIIVGDTLEEIETELSLMIDALKEEILDLDKF